MKTIILSILIAGGSPASILPSDSSIEITEKYVNFTLRNGSLKDIPLIIPGVMNPNLNPMGNSGVSLKVGQEILFKYKGKRRVLLVVDESLEGKTLEVQKLIKEKKKEIDAEK